MRRFAGNQIVKPGLYFNLRQFAFTSIDEQKALPGPDEAVYRRVPVAALLVLAPVIGLAFVVFLPFIGIAMVTWLLARKGLDLTAEAATAAARAVRPAWEPSVAFFTRSKAAKPAATGPVADPWADDAAKTLGHENGKPSPR